MSNYLILIFLNLNKKVLWARFEPAPVFANPLHTSILYHSDTTALEYHIFLNIIEFYIKNSHVLNASD